MSQSWIYDNNPYINKIYEGSNYGITGTIGHGTYLQRHLQFHNLYNIDNKPYLYLSKEEIELTKQYNTINCFI